MGTPAGISKDRLYLCRNTGRSRSATADQDEKLLETFAQVVINNGLECKVACSNSKVCCGTQHVRSCRCFVHCCRHAGQWVKLLLSPCVCRWGAPACALF